MKALFSALGALGVAFLGIVATTSPTVATSNVAGWLEWAGVARVPAFLQQAGADRFVQTAVTVVLTWLVARWWFGRTLSTASDGGISEEDHELSLAGDLLLMADRLAHMRSREWWDHRDPNPGIVADLEALLLTLSKAGFEVPYPQGNKSREDGIDIYTEYMLSVGSLLRSGHGPEARERARSLAARNPRDNGSGA